MARAFIEKVAKSADFKNRKIVTTVELAKPFYDAEEYHQDYYRKNVLHYTLYKKGSGRQDFIEEQSAREAEKTSPDLLIGELELSTRAVTVLENAKVLKVGDALELLEKGDQAMLDIDGFGRKSLADLKRSLKRRGFELPEPVVEG